MAKSNEKSNRPFHNVLKTLKNDNEITIGFSDVDLWANTGVYGLNRLLSNDYNKSFLYGRSVVVYGEPGSGKTLMLAQTAANEQKVNNTFCIWVDPEIATDGKVGMDWFTNAGVDINEEKFAYMRCSTFSKAHKIMVDFVNDYKNKVKNGEDLPPVMFIFDSYSALLTDTQFEQNQGKKPLTGDQGQTAKQIGDLIRRINSMIAGTKILVIGVMHVYMSQDEYGSKHKTTGGIKALFMASQALMLTKYELTNEKAEGYNRISEDNNDKKKVIGIKSKASVLKSRFSKPFENIDMEVVYPYGIDKYSGLMDLLIQEDVITSPSQGWYQFTGMDGDIKKFRRRNFPSHAEELMQLPIKESKLGYQRTPEDIKEELKLVGEIEILEENKISDTLEALKN